jgi:hypothetical protein
MYQIVEVGYQLDLMTPGSLPSDAMFLKQMRQIPNFRINARGRPHKGHRLYARTLNLGLRCAFIRIDVLAKSSSLWLTPIFETASPSASATHGLRHR